MRIENAHEPIVSREVFEQAQEAMVDRRLKPVHQKYSYLLSCMMTCGHCGGRLCGKQPMRKGGQVGRRQYSCKLPKCVKASVNADFIEGTIWNHIKDVVGAPENFELMNAAIMRQDERINSLVSKEAAQLDVLHAKIQKANDALTLASRQVDFDRIGQSIDTLESEAGVLRDSMNAKLKGTGKNVDVLCNRAALLRSLDNLIPSRRRAMIEAMISSLVVHRRNISKGNHFTVEVQIVYSDASGIRAPLVFRSATPQLFKFQELAVWVAERTRPVGYKQIMKRFGINRRLAQKRMSLALRDGLVKPFGTTRFVAGPKIEAILEA